MNWSCECKGWIGIERGIEVVDKLYNVYMLKYIIGFILKIVENEWSVWSWGDMIRFLF